MSTLSRRDLSALPDTIAAPSYDLCQVSAGIVHLGLGGFARAHLARYTHEAMALGDAAALGWGIVGVGLRASDRPLLAALARQDGLYTLVEREGERQHQLVIGSIVGVIDASVSSDALLRAIAAPSIRIVSTTVTEAGYHLDRATKTLDFADPAIVADLTDPERPRTVPGILVDAYRHRRDAGQPAFTSLCCDNIQHNGDVLRAAVLAFARRRDPALAEWIERAARFPNAMVDRITPVPTAATAADFRAATRLDDPAVLHAELFRQWVVEDDFAADRPAWERAGAQFVADVTPYEVMKLRLLNASHLAIAAPGQVCGHALIGEAIGDPLLRRFMIALMERETGPTLKPVPGVDLAAYKRQLVARFANPAIADTTQRVNTDAPINYLLDPIRDRLAAGHSIDLLAFAVAAWCRRLSGRDDAGGAIVIDHPLVELLTARAKAGGADPSPVLSVTALFGELGRDPRFVGAVRGWLEPIYAKGVGATLSEAARRGLI